MDLLEAKSRIAEALVASIFRQSDEVARVAARRINQTATLN